jgi:hypothetical protein
VNPSSITPVSPTVPDLVSTILAKALMMLIEALIARMILHLLRSGLSRNLAGSAGSAF